MSKDVVAKYVARVETRGLDPAVLLGLPDEEVGRLLAPTARQPLCRGRVVPD